MPIGSSLGVTLPSQGGNTGTWGTDLNTALNTMLTALEAQVPSSAIDFSADFAVSGYALTDVGYTSFQQQSSVTALNSLYFDTNGDLYARDGENNNIQLTTSGALNTGSNGGVGDSGGDYGTSDIVFDWDGTNYNAKAGSGDSYAPVKVESIKLQDESTNAITVATPALASDYTLTLPNAVPGTTATILQSDTSGNVTFSNSFAQSITLTGSALYKHPNKEIVFSAHLGYENGGSDWTHLENSSLSTMRSTTADSTYAVPITVPTGARIRSIDAEVSNDTATSRSLTLYRSGQGAIDTRSSLGTAASTTPGAYTHTISSIDHTVLANQYYYVEFTSASDATLAYFKHVTVTYDQP